MNRIDYFNKCNRTCPDLGSLQDNIDHMAAGVITEFGELIDVYKKELAYKKEVDRPNVVEECGDIAWYLFNAIRFLLPYPGICEKLLEEGESIVMEGGIADTYRELLEEAHANGESSLYVVMNAHQNIMTINTDFFAFGDIGIQNHFETAHKLIAAIIMWEETMKFIGVNPEEAYARNINKLMVRFPDKFSEEGALLRDLLKERKTLE